MPFELNHSSYIQCVYLSTPSPFPQVFVLGCLCLRCFFEGRSFLSKLLVSKVQPGKILLQREVLFGTSHSWCSEASRNKALLICLHSVLASRLSCIIISLPGSCPFHTELFMRMKVGIKFRSPGCFLSEVL